MTKPKASLPAKCPACQASTSDNFNQPKRAGLHCHSQTTAKWVANCGVIVCQCGVGYHAHGHTSGPMTGKGAKK